MLTRRDQLKLKEEKQKNENPEDACDETKEHDGEEPQDAKKTKGSGKGKGTKKEGKAKGKAKAQAKTKSSNGKKDHQPGLEEEGEDQEGPKVEVSDDHPPEEMGEASGSEMNGMETPKKALFQSDDDGSHDDFDMPTPPAMPKFLCPKTGKEKTLQEIFDNYVPAAWKRSKRQKSSEESTKPGPPTPKAKSRAAKAKAKAGSKAPIPKAKGKAEAKAKAKTKAKRKAQDTPSHSKQVMQSPAIKKEIKRRKKKETEAMAEQAQDMKDTMMQGILVQKIKNVLGMGVEECKAHLRDTACPMYPMTYLSAYWTRSAVAIVLRDENGKATTHLEYFGFNKAESKNANYALAYGSAWLMVPCHLMDGPSC